jgi:ADP-heptose:LPS heptosyltransferase
VENARRLVHAAVGRAPDVAVEWALRIPEASRAEATRLLAPFGGGLKVGMHVSGGRAIKQWPEGRFRDVAEHLVTNRSATIVLTGSPADRAQVELVRAALPPNRVLDLSADVSLLTAAAVIEQLDLFVTGDTGPMHLANAVGTPIVAVFGPSDPRRYAPRGVRDTVVRIDLPCSPCNRIRRPPERCVGHTPDCLAGIETAQVLAAIDETLRLGAAR